MLCQYIFSLCRFTFHLSPCSAGAEMVQDLSDERTEGLQGLRWAVQKSMCLQGLELASGAVPHSCIKCSRMRHLLVAVAQRGPGGAVALEAAAK